MIDEEEFDEQEESPGATMQELLDELNEKTYQLFARLDTNREFLTEKQYGYMASALYEQYKKAYELLDLEHSIGYKTKMFELKTTSRFYVPRKILFYRNKMGYVIGKDIEENFVEVYGERLAELKCEIAKAERKRLQEELKQAKKDEKRAKEEARKAKQGAKKAEKQAKKEAQKRKKSKRGRKTGKVNTRAGRETS